MDAAVIAGIIGAISTIFAALVSPIVAAFVENKKKAKYIPSAPVAQEDSLYGKWVGYMDQKTGIKKVCNKHELVIEFISNSSPIVGAMVLRFVANNEEIIIQPNNVIRGNIINTIYDGRILKTDYVNKNNNAIHFGTLYGKLSSDGSKIDGHFLGFGLVSEQFVTGRIHLEKQGELASK